MGRVADARPRGAQRPVIEAVIGDDGLRFLELTGERLAGFGTDGLSGAVPRPLPHRQRSGQQFFGRFDVLLTPTWTAPPFEHGFDIRSVDNGDDGSRDDPPSVARQLPRPAGGGGPGRCRRRPAGRRPVHSRTRFADLTALAAAAALEAAVGTFTPIDPRGRRRHRSRAHSVGGITAPRRVPSAAMDVVVGAGRERGRARRQSSPVRAGRPLPAGGRAGLPLGCAGARPPARSTSCASIAATGSTRPPSCPATRARRSARSTRRLGRAAAHRARPPDRHAAGRQRGARRHRGDGQPARRLARRQALRRRDGHVVRQGARPRPRRRRHPPRRVRRHAPPRRRRRRGRRRPGRQVVDAARPRATPRWSTCTCRSCSPATCRRRSTSAATPSPCRGRAGSGPASSWSRRSPTARAPSTSHPDRVEPVDPDDGVRRQAVRPPPERPAAHPVHARHGARVPRGPLGARPPVRRRQRAQPHHRRAGRRLDRHRRQRPHVPRAARGARRCSGSPTTRRCATPASGCSSCSCRCRSTISRSASSPTGSPRCSSSRRRTRRSSGS